MRLACSLEVDNAERREVHIVGPCDDKIVARADSAQENGVEIRQSQLSRHDRRIDGDPAAQRVDQID